MDFMDSNSRGFWLEYERKKRALPPMPPKEYERALWKIERELHTEVKDEA
jgi:hypothetical protein